MIYALIAVYVVYEVCIMTKHEYLIYCDLHFIEV